MVLLIITPNFPLENGLEVLILKGVSYSPQDKTRFSLSWKQKLQPGYFKLHMPLNPKEWFCFIDLMIDPNYHWKLGAPPK